MHNDANLLATLSLFTLIAVVVIGGWQWRKVRDSQRKRGEKPTGHPSDLTS